MLNYDEDNLGFDPVSTEVSNRSSFDSNVAEWRVKFSAFGSICRVLFS